MPAVWQSVPCPRWGRQRRRCCSSWRKYTAGRSTIFWLWQPLERSAGVRPSHLSRTRPCSPMRIAFRHVQVILTMVFCLQVSGRGAAFGRAASASPAALAAVLTGWPGAAIPAAAPASGDCSRRQQARCLAGCRTLASGVYKC